MKKTLILYKDYHPLFQPYEVINKCSQILNLSYHNSLVYILFHQYSNILEILVYLYQGQYSYIPIPTSLGKPILGKWAWLSIKPYPIAYLSPKYLHISLYKNNPSLQEYREEFFLGLAISNIMDKGIRHIIIDTEKLELTGQAEDIWQGMKNIYHPFKKNNQKKIVIHLYFIIREIQRNKLLQWLRSLQQEVYHNYIVIEILNLDNIYQILCGNLDKESIEKAIFITSNGENSVSSDYDNFTQYIFQNNIPYGNIHNTISHKQITHTVKESLKHRLEQQIKNMTFTTKG